MCVPSSPGVSIQWEATAYTASEGSGAVQLVLLREGETTSDITVTVTTMAATATSKYHSILRALLGGYMKYFECSYNL